MKQDARAAAVALIAWAWCAAPLFAQDIYTPIPSGFDFPADEASQLKLRDDQDVSGMRRHAWNVWAGLNQPAAGGGPIWETWFRSADTFRAGAGPAAARRSIRRELRPPRQHQLPGVAAAGQSLMSDVLFNRETHEHIRDNQFHQQQILNAINQGFPQGTPVEQREIKDFPREAVSLKSTWWLVKQQGITPMPVWDNEPTQPVAAGNPPRQWKRLVGVDPSRQQIPADETTELTVIDPVTKAKTSHPGSHVVSLSAFYSFTLQTPEEIAAAQRSDTTAAKGDHVVLVALHVTTKEIDDWVWATFWWHDAPDRGPFAADRTQNVPGVWRNFLMDVAYSMDMPREYDGTPNACYNPWLEARFPNGLASNCMTCHQRSTWPSGSFLPVTRGALPANDAFFANKTKLDFLWSIGFESQ